MRVDGKLDLDLGELLALLPLELRNGLADQAYVEVETDRRDVPGLLAAEQVAGTADLEVLHRDLHAGPEVGVLRDRREPVVRLLCQWLLRRVEEVGVGTVTATADPATQLVQLGETEQVGSLDDERVGIGDVQATL